MDKKAVVILILAGSLMAWGGYEFLIKTEPETVIVEKYFEPPHYERRPMGFFPDGRPNGWQERFVKDTGYFFIVSTQGKREKIRVAKFDYDTRVIGSSAKVMDTAAYRKYLQASNNQTRAVE